MVLGRLADAVGRGILAGAAGTVAMTASGTVERIVREGARGAPPAEAAGPAGGIEPPVDEEAEVPLSNLARWAYGIGWGAVRGLLAPLGPVGATAAHLALVWGTALAMLPRLGVAPSARGWSAAELGIDLLHHAVYATATGLAYAALEG